MNVHHLVGLLQETEIIPYRWHFRYNPLPQSENLSEDLRDSYYTGDLDKSQTGSLSLTEKGSHWVKGVSSKADYNTVVQIVGDELKLFSKLTPEEIISELCSKINR